MHHAGNRVSEKLKGGEAQERLTAPRLCKHKASGAFDRIDSQVRVKRVSTQRGTHSRAARSLSSYAMTVKKKLNCSEQTLICRRLL
jgi:hypothetical protein